MRPGWPRTQGLLLHRQLDFQRLVLAGFRLELLFELADFQEELATGNEFKGEDVVKW